MRFAITFGHTCLVFLALFSSCCQAKGRRLVGARRRRLGPGGKKQQSKTKFSGLTANAEVDWQTNAACLAIDEFFYNIAYVTASKTSNQVGPNGKTGKTTYEDVYFSMLLFTDCQATSIVYTYFDFYTDLEEALPDTDITIDAKLKAGTITSTGEAYVTTVSCELAQDSVSGPYYYDPCGCTEDSSDYEVITIETKLTGTGTAMPSKYSQSYSDSSGGYDYRYTGTSRDAILVSMKVTRDDGSVVTVPVSGDSVLYVYGALGKATGGETTYYTQ